jgi:hypothetical protein
MDEDWESMDEDWSNPSTIRDDDDKRYNTFSTSEAVQIAMFG